MNRRDLFASLFGAALVKELPKPEVTPIPPVVPALPTSVVCSALAYYPPAYSCLPPKWEANSTIYLGFTPRQQVSPLESIRYKK